MGLRALERHITTIVVTLIAAAMIWAGNSISRTLEATTRLEVKVETISEKVLKMDNTVSNLPTRNQFETILKRIDDHEQRLRDIEQKVNGND